MTEATASATPRFRVYFAIGTDTWGRRLQTSMAQRAATAEEAVDLVVASGVNREAIVSVGRDE